MNPNKNVEIFFEVCTNCELHQWCTHHQPNKYLNHFNKSKFLNRITLHLKISKKRDFGIRPIYINKIEYATQILC